MREMIDMFDYIENKKVKALEVSLSKKRKCFRHGSMFKKSKNQVKPKKYQISIQVAKGRAVLPEAEGCT